MKIPVTEAVDNKWPMITILSNGELEIVFPSNRPYENEIINLMSERGYDCTGTGYYLLEGLRNLYFKDRGAT